MERTASSGATPHVGDAEAQSGGQAAHGTGNFQFGPNSIVHFNTVMADGSQKHWVAKGLSWWDFLLGPLLVVLGTGIMQFIQRTVFPSAEYDMVMVPVEVFAVVFTLVGYVEILRHREQATTAWFLATLAVFAVQWGLWLSLLFNDDMRPTAIGMGWGVIVLAVALAVFDMRNLYQHAHPGRDQGGVR